MFNYKSFTNIVLILIVILLVAIAGYFVFMEKTAMPVQISTPVSLTPDEIAFWKTYTNTKYGFEVKYPDYWEIDSSSWETNSSTDGVEYPYYHYIPFLGVLGEDTERIGLGTADILNGENYDFSTIADFRKWHDRYMGSNEVEKAEKSKINQLNIIKTHEANGVNSVGEYIYIIHDNLVIFLTHDSADDAQTQLVFDKFVSTFKFVE
ncbi:MAG: PsbP-related protein [Candidatus Pacebacteria bacterium]|nr:PsbP-related protein [Candidatus Paceibacterota bacterium]